MGKPVKARPEALGSYGRSGLRRGMLTVALVTGLAPGLLWAQEFPSRPIRLMVGTPPGGSIDAGARAIAQPLSEILQTPVVVENKPGAAGMINSEFVAKAAPDGYTLMVGTPSPVIIAPQAMPKATFNPLTDVAAINMVSTSPIAVAVNPKLPVRNLKDLVALSRTRQVTMALPLAGSASHLVTEMVAKAAGINFLNVSYKGAAPATTDTIAGHTDSTVSDVGVYLSMHREGRLRIVFVTSEKRIDALPDVPAINEDVPGLVVTNWIGIFAPAKTPRPVLEKINAAIARAVVREDVRERAAKSAVTSTTMSGIDEFQKFVTAEYHRYGQIVRERKIVIGD